MKSELELAEILDRCLEQMQAGTPLTEVLKQYPDKAEQLRPLLAMSVDLEALPDPHYSMDSVMQTMVKAAEQHKRDAAPALWMRWLGFFLPRQTVRSAKREAGPTWRFGFQSAPLLYRMATLVLMTLVIFWGAGTISADAVPGDFLYPLKLLTERAKFYLTLNTEDKVELRIVFSSERLREAIKKHERDGNLDPQLLQQMLEEARQAVESSVALPKSSRDLLVAQTKHLSQFEGQTLKRFQQQLPEQEQAAVTPYVEMSERRAMWMQQMCDDWQGDPIPRQPRTIPSPNNGWRCVRGNNKTNT